MPELPEVETYRLELAPALTNAKVKLVEVFWPSIIAAPSAEQFQTQMAGQQFADFGRRGKYLILYLKSDHALIVHLRMTGELHIHPPEVLPDKHTHVLFSLADGRTLHYRDQRKFGRLWLVKDADMVVGRLGPEPLEDNFSPQDLSIALTKRKSNIKSLLLNQSIVAGVGNIYADEALFRAGIDPRRNGNTLTEAEISALHHAIRTVLKLGIEMGGSSLQNYVRLGGMKGNFQDQHQVFRKTGQPCPRCEAPIERIVLGQRSTHLCPNCQS